MSNKELHVHGQTRSGNIGTLRTEQWRYWAGYAIAAGSVLSLTIMLALLQPYFPDTSFRIPYVVAVILIGYYFGTGPAVLTLVLGLLSFLYLYIPPRYSVFPIAYTPDHWAEIVTIIVGTSIAGWLSILFQRAMRRAERARTDLVEANAALRNEIRERERVEAALERSESRFRSTFERAGIGMTVVDMKGYVLAANPAFSELTGYSREELPGMHVQDYAYPEDLPHGNELLGEMVEGKRDSYTVEKRYVTKDGRVIWGRLTASIARNPAPEPPFIIGMIEDITERKLAEQREHEREASKLEFYRRTITAATNGKFVIADRSEIEDLCKSQEPAAQLDIRLPSDLAGARDKAREIASSVGVDEDRGWEFATCVGEAITNAIKHAGGGTASLYRLPDGLLFVISDQGSGIPALTLPDVALRRSYSTVGTLGMGYKVMMSFGDRVYLATGPEGTTVAIRMNLQPEDSSIADMSWAGSLA